MRRGYFSDVKCKLCLCKEFLLPLVSLAHGEDLGRVFGEGEHQSARVWGFHSLGTFGIPSLGFP